MATCLIQEDTTESLRNGFLELTVDQVWQVETAGRAVAADVVLADPGLPTLGTSQTFGSYALWNVSRVARRVDTDSTGRLWNVSYIWTNNSQLFLRDKDGQPVSDPTLSVKTVNISYQEYDEPIADAKFLGINRNVPLAPGGTPDSDPPPWLTVGSSMPPKVSTGQNILGATRTEFNQSVEVGRVEKTWNATYETYTNKVNSLQVQILETDSTGTVATYTFAPGTLLMLPITKTPMWQSDGNLYFNIRFPMEYRPEGWLRNYKDASQQRRCFVGQTLDKDLAGETMDQAYIDDVNGGNACAVAFQNITNTDPVSGAEVAIGEPEDLNGYGNTVNRYRIGDPTHTDETRYYLAYEVFEEIDFTPLGL
jgi:hypothetical protein